MYALELTKAIAEGKTFWMRKYLYCGIYSAPKLVSAEQAEHKSQVRTKKGFCPYAFEIAD